MPDSSLIGQAWLDFDASSIAVADSFPTTTLTAPGFSETAPGSFPTGPFSGGDSSNSQSNVSNVVAKAVGITVVSWTESNVSVA
jgi:hypothetical protein